jgi:uncharacterized protein with GYD domain
MLDNCRVLGQNSLTVTSSSGDVGRGGPREVSRMATYIALGNWTDQGIKNVRESGGRAEAFRKMAEEMGCRVQGLFFTMGRYDLALRVEAPDDATISALMLKVASLGNVRTETMRAYTEAEFAQLSKKVSG